MKKKKISRILGVVLTLVLLSSFFVASAPVGAAAQAWGTYGIPSATGMVLDAGNTWTGPFAQAIDGSAIYAGSNVGGLAPAAGKTLVKSTDGGRTWKAQTGGLPALVGAGAITDIVASSQNANTVYITDGFDIYKTTDAGTTWAPLSNLFGSGVGAAGFITSIDIGYLGGSPYIFAATSSFGAGTGGAYVAQEAVFGMPWSDLLIDTDRAVPWAANSVDVLEIQVDPANFATTQMVMALATNFGGTEGPNAVLTTKYAGSQWDATVNDVALPGVVGSTLYAGDFWLPSDFNSSLVSGNMQAFAAVDSGAAGVGDVFLAVFGAPSGAPNIAFDLNIAGGPSAREITGLDGIGSAAAATMLASGYNSAAPTIPAVFRSVDGGLTWALNTKRPTGGATPLGHPVPGALSSVMMLDASNAIVGTHGADASVAGTSDGGATWNSLSLLNSAFNTVDDLDFRADGTVFLAADMTGGDSIWRNAGSWERVYSDSLLGGNPDPEMVQSSPDGSTVFHADLSGEIMRSTDDGGTWTQQVSVNPGGVINQDAWLVIDTSTILVGGAGGAIYSTTNNGVIWFTRTSTIGTVQSFDVAANGDILASGSTGIAVSTNNGVTWTSKAQPGANTTTLAVFGSDYVNTGEIFATGTGTPGVYSWIWGTSTAWTQIDGAPGALAGTSTGIVTAPADTSQTNDGMVYATDTAGTGVIRIKGNRTVAEAVPDAGAPMGLWYQPGSNVLYTIVGATVRTYTDLLAVSGTGVSVSGVTVGAATVSWTALPGAATYRVSVVAAAQQTNVYTSTNTFTGAGTTTAVAGLAANTTYSVSVWALTPVTSFLFSGDSSFTTLPGAILAPPQNLIPAHGAINIPVDGPAFAWGAPTGGATSYDWQLSTDPTFTSITEGSVNTTLTFLVWEGPLAYEQDYYWRVRANTAAGTGPWATQVFTTVAEALPPVTVPPQITPTVIIPTQAPPTVILPTPQVTVVPPDVIVNLPTPVVTTQPPSVIQLPDEDTPVYIWAIVAIGAILTIAVIVLIVRTRRVV
jgi:hypothetical protein